MQLKEFKEYEEFKERSQEPESRSQKARWICRGYDSDS
jgi:hypothetical protein